MSSSTPYVRLPDSPTRIDIPHASNVRARSRSSSYEKPLPEVGGVHPGRGTMSQFVGANSRKTALPRRLPLTLVLLLVAAVTVIVVVPKRKEASAALAALRWRSATSLQLDPRGRPIVDFESFPVPQEWACNPYKETGRLLVNIDEPVSNISA